MNPLAPINPHVRKLMADSARVWLAHAFAMVLALAASVLVARALMPEGRGVYAWLVAAAGILTQFAMMGMDINNRRLGDPHHTEAAKNLPRLINLTLRLCGMGGTLIAILTGAVIYYSNLTTAPLLDIALAVAIIPLAATFTSLSMLLTTRQNTGALMQSILAPRVLTMALTWGAYATGTLSLTMAIAISTLNQFISLGICAWYLRDVWPRTTESTPWHRFFNRTFWHVTIAAYGAGLAQLVMQKADILMIGSITGAAAAGYYSVAVTITDIMIAPAQIGATLLSARLSQANSAEQFTPRLLQRIFALGFGVLTLGALFTVGIAPWVVPFLFGVDFTPTVSALYWLAPAAVVLGIYMLAQCAVSTTASARQVLYSPVAGCVLNIALNLYLIPHYGIPGACMSSLIAYTVATGISLAILRQHKRI